MYVVFCKFIGNFNVLVIVTRYFGGIKLGTGGLVRAYSKGVLNALSLANFIELQNGYKIKLEFDYSSSNDVSYILGDSQIIEKSFNAG